MLSQCGEQTAVRGQMGTCSATSLQGSKRYCLPLFRGAESGGAFQPVTGGVGNVKFWRVKGKALKPAGAVGKKGKVQPVLCAANVGTRVVTGTVTGHLYVWSGNEVVKSIKAHERSVNALHSCRSGLISGSKDGIVKMWDTKLSPIRAFNMAETTPTVQMRGSLRVLGRHGD